MSFQQLPLFLKKSLLAAALLLGIANAAFAQQYYTAATSSYNNFPFNGSATSGSMCQFLYTPSDFNTTPPGAYNITTVYFKAANTGSTTYSNLTMKLGNTTATALASGTWNSGLTTVLSSSSYSSSWVSGNWYGFTLSTPFFYTGGNLIIEVSQAGTSSGMGVWYWGASTTRRMYGAVGSSSSTGADSNPLSFGFDAIPGVCSGTPTPDTVKTAAMSPAAPICSGSTKSLTSSVANLGTGITYQWQSSSSATGPWTNVSTGTGATTITYTTGALSSSTYFRVATICSNSGLSAYSQPYLVLVGAPQPGTISGNILFCPGDTTTYSVPNVTGTTYTWTLPSGWSYVYNNSPNTNSILATPSGISGTISVTASSSCGTSIAQTKSVFPGSAPAQPGTISGPTSACPNSSQTFSVTPVATASSYQWTLPTGWSGTSTTNSITVTTGGGSSSGNVLVKAVNGCGQSSGASLAVTIITSLPNPGTITGPATVCSGQIYGYSISAVPGATSYVWVLPSGWSGNTTGTSIQVFPGSTSGTLTVTAYSSCATSPTSSLAVTATTTVTPSVSISRAQPTQCSNKPNTFTATPINGGTTPTYQWMKNGGNVGSNSATYTDVSLQTGDRINVVMTSTAACASPASISSRVDTATVTTTLTPGISVNTTPPIIICAGSMVNFTPLITGGGTAPRYQWYKNGNILLNDTLATYNSNSLLDNDTLTVTLTSNAPCVTSTTALSNKVGIRVNQYVTPSVSITASSTVIIPGVSITYTATQSGGGPAPSYQWQKSGVDIPFATGSTFTDTTASVPGDQITVKMISSAPCPTSRQVSSNVIVLTADPLSVAGIGSWQGAVSLYPNPTSGRFTIAASWGANHIGRRVSVDIINTLGQSVYHTEAVPGGASWHMDVNLGTGLSGGRYMMRISSDDNMRSTVPFVLAR